MEMSISWRGDGGVLVLTYIGLSLDSSKDATCKHVINFKVPSLMLDLFKWTNQNTRSLFRIHRCHSGAASIVIAG